MAKTSKTSKIKKPRKSRYLDKDVLSELSKACEPFLPLRNEVYKKFGIDPLSTDVLSSLDIHKIVSQYDPDYNVNFARNGEDGKSNNVLIESKAATIAPDLTATGKMRKNAGTDAGFQFHALGDLQHSRYILVARFKDTLGIDRLYDISDPINTAMVYQNLVLLKDAWLAAGAIDPKKMKRDAIIIPEKVLIKNLVIRETLQIGNTKVFKA